MLEDYQTNVRKFNPDKLEELYSLFTGSTNATYKTLETWFNSSAKTHFDSDIISANDISKKTDGKDIVLTFGKLEWTVTSLTKDNEDRKSVV